MLSNGDGGNDNISGNNGSDTLYGGGGNDTLNGVKRGSPSKTV